MRKGSNLSQAQTDLDDGLMSPPPESRWTLVGLTANSVYVRGKRFEPTVPPEAAGQVKLSTLYRGPDGAVNSTWFP